MPKPDLQIQAEQLKKRGLVNRKPISNAVKIELWNMFSELSERTGINKSKLLDQAMILVINYYQEYSIIEKRPIIKLKSEDKPSYKLEIERLKKRGLVNRKPISNAVDIELWNMFNELSERTGVNKSKLLDQALILLLNHYQEYPLMSKQSLIKLKNKA